jgi:hypothetical protein
MEIYCRVVILLCAAALGAMAWAGPPTLTGKTPAEWAAQIRPYLAKEKGLPEGTWANRLAAAAIAEKTSAAGGVVLYPSTMATRTFTALPRFVLIENAVRKTALPDEYKDLLLKSIGGTYVYPIRQDIPRIGVEHWKGRIAEIPAESRMVTIADGETLATHIAAAYPAFADLTPMQQKLVYDGLAAINPLVEPCGSYLGTAPAPGKPRVWRADVGVDLEPLQLQYILYEIDPATRLMPAEVEAAAQGKPNGDALSVSIGGGDARVCLYRILPGARVLMPPAEYLTALANPTAVDLRNSWIRDLTVLDGLNPEALDLRGNDCTDLAPLARMKGLRVLRLDNTRINTLDALKGLPLTQLDLADTAVTDLSPLKGMKLERLVLRGTRVTSLAPLQGMPLRYLDLGKTAGMPLDVVVAMPLTYLQLNLAARYASFDPVVANPVATIGDVPKADWFADYAKYQTASGGYSIDDDDDPPTTRVIPPVKPPVKPPVVPPIGPPEID